MLSVSHEGRRYVVIFKYPPEIPDRTLCQIYLDNSPAGQRIPGRLELLVQASADRYYLDQPNKDAGRKTALTRAISTFNVAIRSVFWKAYHAQIGPLAKLARKQPQPATPLS